jgi:hypothetical protein
VIKINEVGTYAILTEEKLSDGSSVFNVRVYPFTQVSLPRTLSPASDGVELLIKDEATAQKLFNMIEEACVGITDC